MTFRPSSNLAHLKTSETVAISTEAKRRKAAGDNVLDLGVGEPDFDTPSAVADAGIAAIRAGKTRYPPNVGIVELRHAMAGALSRMSGGRAVDPDRLIVSNGSKQALFNACFTLFGPGDGVLIPSPAWVSYPQIVHLARATPVRRRRRSARAGCSCANSINVLAPGTAPVMMKARFNRPMPSRSSPAATRCATGTPSEWRV